MSFFSDKFREAVAASAVPVAQLAAQSGVSPAMLYKIQSGTRLPDSLETLDTLLDILHCSLPQKQSLRQEYLICRIGLHRYNSFQQLKEMLSDFAVPTMTAPEIQYRDTSRINTVITGETNVNMVIQRLLDQEIRLPGGGVQMFLDLKFRHCFSYMSQSLTHCPEDFTTVTHLFCLRATAADDAILHNMSIFRDVLPQMAMLSHYDPRYCYLPDPNDGTVPFPYFIITSAGVLQLSGSLQSAVFLTDPAVVEQYRLMFFRMAENFSPCMQGGEAALETYFHGYHQIIGRHTPGQIRPVIIAAIPCMLPCVDPKTALSYLPPEMLEEPELQAIAQEYFSGAAVGGYETFYTLEGLKHVIETGEIMELQGDFVPRARQEHILDALEEFLRRAKAGILTPRLFRTDLIPVTTQFSMTLRGRELMLYCSASQQRTVYASLAEDTLATVVSDYVASAEMLGDIYSPEDSIALTEQLLRKYRN